MKFEIVDLSNSRVLETVEEKGAADRRFVELQKEHPKKKLWLKMVSK